MPSQDQSAHLSSFWEPWLPVVYSCAPSQVLPLWRRISSPYFRSPEGLPSPEDWGMWSCKVSSLLEIRTALKGRSSSRTSCSISYTLWGDCITVQLLAANSPSLTNSPHKLSSKPEHFCLCISLQAKRK